MGKKIIGILLIALIAIVSTVSYGYYIFSQSNQTDNTTKTLSPTPTPIQSPSETPTKSAYIPKPSVPEFTVKLVPYSYDVPPTSSTDPYTGKTVTHEGYHIESKKIEVKIKNQPFVPYLISDNSSGATRSINFYYNIRVKGYFGEDWSELYTPEYYIIQDSGSKYTVISYINPHRISTLASISIDFPPDAQVDFQVEAMIGYTYEGFAGFTYRAFVGEESGWSNTQTINIP